MPLISMMLYRCEMYTVRLYVEETTSVQDQKLEEAALNLVRGMENQ